MTTLIFDIETEALPEAELRALLPPFDPADVKLGNLKDPVKIAEKLKESEAAHAADFIERAALDACTARVLAIGLLDYQTGAIDILSDNDEAELLRVFWNVVRGQPNEKPRMVGWNSNGFDLPFLIRRSWKHDLNVPLGVRNSRYWDGDMIDLMDIWSFGRPEGRKSLDAVGKHLGIGQKNGSGKDFAPLWHTDQAKAIEYLENDLRLTAKLAERILD